MKIALLSCLKMAVVIVVVTVGIIAITPETAYAHGIGGIEPSKSISIVKSVQPETSSFEIQSIENGQRVEIKRTGSEVVVVLGVSGEPFVKLERSGIYRNTKSPTYLINQSTKNNLSHEAMKEAFEKTSDDPNATPDWKKISSSNVYRWHDHRAHYMGDIPKGEEFLGTSEIAIEVSGKPVLVTFEYRSKDQPTTLIYFGVFFIVAVLIVVGVKKNSKIQEFAYSQKLVAGVCLLVALLETSHIFGYMLFSKETFGGKFSASIYGVALVLVSAITGIKLLVYKTQEKTGELAVQKYAPLISLTGLIGISVGFLIEYKIFLDQYLVTSLSPTLSRVSVLLVGLSSILLLVIGIPNLRTGKKETSQSAEYK